MARPSLRMAWRVLLVIALAAGAASGGYWAVWRSRSHVRAVASPGIAVPGALLSAGAVPSASAAPPVGTPATAAGVAHALASVLTDPALRPQLLARVVDAQTGAVLYDHLGASTAAPASTAKILTAAAILTVHPASYRFTTTVRVAGTTAYLVGGGDPTLTAAATGGPYPGAARLSTLAAQLRAAHLTIDKIVVDDSLFSGPAISPDWLPEDVPSEYGAAITAVMTDGGRAAPTDVIRSAAPDLAAGHELAAALGHAGLGVSRGTAPGTASVVARVASAPLSTLVEQMLEESDNVIADVLARQVAVALHAPATFLGGAAAIRTVMGRLGVDIGAGMRDGSGLAAADRLSPAALVAALRVVGGFGSGATATQAGSLIPGLPVSGWSGTLADRYVSGSAAVAAGVVRAKTGSLDGITALAGYVHDDSGRLLVFSFDADRTPIGATSGAEAAIDRVVAALARCGCS